MTPTLYQGIAAACLAGLIAGGFMQPDLREGAGAEGPQMLAGVSGSRSEPGWNGAALTNWNGPVPDYVIGTDYLYPPAYAGDAPFEVADASFDEHVYHEPPAEAEPQVSPLATWNFIEDEPQAANPSEGGDILAGVAPPPPEPPFEDEAPAPSA